MAVQAFYGIRIGGIDKLAHTASHGSPHLLGEKLVVQMQELTRLLGYDEVRRLAERLEVKTPTTEPATPGQAAELRCSYVADASWSYIDEHRPIQHLPVRLTQGWVYETYDHFDAFETNRADWMYLFNLDQRLFEVYEGGNAVEDTDAANGRPNLSVGIDGRYVHTWQLCRTPEGQRKAAYAPPALVFRCDLDEAPERLLRWIIYRRKNDPKKELPL